MKGSKFSSNCPLRLPIRMQDFVRPRDRILFVQFCAEIENELFYNWLWRRIETSCWQEPLLRLPAALNVTQCPIISSNTVGRLLAKKNSETDFFRRTLVSCYISLHAFVGEILILLSFSFSFAFAVWCHQQNILWQHTGRLFIYSGYSDCVIITATCSSMSKWKTLAESERDE